MEQLYEEACKNGDIRGALAESFRFQKAFGRSSPDKLLTLDSTFRIASCSKLITSIAVMQCVEQGLVKLDEDVSPILHELKGIQILEGFNSVSGDPVLRRSDANITLRSGLGYDLFVPLLQQWRAYHHENVGIPASDFTRAYFLPLLFEPGQGWEYGPGIEWAGILIERLTGTNLQQYIQENIGEPLGLRNMTFHLEERPDIRQNLCHTSYRHAGGELDWTTEEILPDPIKESLGGVGIYSTALDYFAVLEAVLVGDERLLSGPATIDLLKPQLSSMSRQALNKIVQDLDRATGFGIPPGIEVDHSLAGIINVNSLDTGRRGGSVSWGGYPNLKWWVDRNAGLCGLYASQLHPPGDAKSVELYFRFQAEMYKRLHSTRGVEMGLGEQSYHS
ncbi:hypothetical protein LTR84_005684 [Exophiala bonariae]|uniref:Beta-lactamase-related domain-containing protein n=1 Tax=Exophiala bonariae TaxID=1690606 RepID=A0AAV9N7A0_9EURO|nr:hypothetical protein LTR84_005684 [Exophiala bonariae]